ncbi:MAG: DUF2911 domain-containing protein [Roseivirga sp.]|nr:DUF2911 domain-containing protein [Roseivirga sp.]
MKTTFLLLFLCLSFQAQAQIQTPALSPLATSTQQVGITTISLQYWRPSTRGRAIFGENGTLPKGEFWRTGANGATKITFSSDVIIGGKPLSAGSYTLLSIPGKSSWQVNWYAYETGTWTDYVEKEPLLTMSLPVQETGIHMETLRIDLQDIALHSANLSIEWETTLIKIPIEVDDKARILSSIERTMAGPSNFDYFQAALYLHESGTDLNKALEYIQNVTKSEGALFFQVTREAQILQDLGKNERALKVTRRALLLSQEANNMDFIRLNNKIMKEVSESIKNENR